LVNGTLRGGTLQSLTDADGDRLVVGPEDANSRSGSGVSTSTFAPAGAITQITLGVRSSNTLPSGATQLIQLYNWGTSSFEIVDTRATTTGDSSAILSITSNPSRFVNSSTREVIVKVLHRANPSSSGSRWTMAIDQLGTHFN
jgi:hypothetical protein